MRRFCSLFAALAVLVCVVAASGGTAAAGGTAPSAKKADRNADGLPDRWERRYGLSLRRKQGERDPDKDGLRNADEFRLGTNPRYSDTDNDRLADGDERPTGNNPLDRDSDDDGVLDGRENPGRIAGLRYGVLTLRLADDQRVRALVNDDTGVACAGPSRDPGTGEDDAGDHGDVTAGERVLARTDYDAKTVTRGSGEPTADIGMPVCGRADLRRGAIVHAADLHLEDGVLVVRSIALFRRG